jgi:hypothetical protein
MSVLISSACLAMTLPAAASVDVLSFVQKELLHCIHPTVKVDKAKVEIDKPTITDGDTTTTRVRVFYEGGDQEKLDGGGGHGEGRKASIGESSSPGGYGYGACAKLQVY